MMLASTRRRILAFALGEIPVQARVLHRDGRLRGEQLEDGHSRGSKRVRREVVLQVQHPEQPGLLEYRQAEHRPRVVLANVVIGGEWVLARGIVQQNAFFGPKDIAENGLRQICSG